MGNLTTMSYGKANDGTGVTRIVIDGRVNEAINFTSVNGKLYQFTDKQAQNNLSLSLAIDNASNAHPVHVSEKDSPAFMRQLDILKTTAIQAAPPKSTEEVKTIQNHSISYLEKRRHEPAYPPAPQEKYEERLPPLDKALENIFGYKTNTAQELKKTITQETKDNNQKQINIRLSNLLSNPSTAPAAQLFGTLSEHLSALKTKGISPPDFSAQNDMQKLINQAGLLENPQNKVPSHLTQQSFDPHAGLRDAAAHSTPATATHATQK